MSYPQTPLNTEEVMQRLYELGCSISYQDSPTKFRITSRRFKHWTLVPREQWPAFYQMQIPQALSGGERGLLRGRLGVWWFVYLPPGSDTDPVPISATMNRYRDALLDLFKPTPTAPVLNLGIRGVERIYPDGPLLMDEGLMEPPSLIRIQLTILTGN